MDSLKMKMESIAQLLSDYTQLKNMTQRDLALVLGKEVSYINKILQGEANLNLRTLVEIEDCLDISLLSAPDRLLPKQTFELYPPARLSQTQISEEERPVTDRSLCFRTFVISKSHIN